MKLLDFSPKVNTLLKFPGIYYHPHPLGKLHFQSNPRPDTLAAAQAAEFLLELSLCQHSKVVGK